MRNLKSFFEFELTKIAKNLHNKQMPMRPLQTISPLSLKFFCIPGPQILIFIVKLFCASNHPLHHVTRHRVNRISRHFSLGRLCYFLFNFLFYLILIREWSHGRKFLSSSPPPPPTTLTDVLPLTFTSSPLTSFHQSEQVFRLLFQIHLI